MRRSFVLALVLVVTAALAGCSAPPITLIRSEYEQCQQRQREFELAPRCC